MMRFMHVCWPLSFGHRAMQDYFEFQSGPGAREISPETNAQIKQWLKENP